LSALARRRGIFLASSRKCDDFFISLSGSTARYVLEDGLCFSFV
jgi:hypothetical protein